MQKHNLEGYLKGSQTLPQGVQDKDVVKDKVKAKRFVKPSLGDLENYCTERNNKVDVVKFFNYYESNGWKVGKNPMKDWMAAIRTWEKNTEAPKKSKVEQSLSTWQEARQMINNG